MSSVYMVTFYLYKEYLLNAIHLGLPDHLKLFQGLDILSFRDYRNFTSCLLRILFRYSGVAFIMTTQPYFNSLLFTTQLF